MTEPVEIASVLGIGIDLYIHADDHHPFLSVDDAGCTRIAASSGTTIADLLALARGLRDGGEHHILSVTPEES